MLFLAEDKWKGRAYGIWGNLGCRGVFPLVKARLELGTGFVQCVGQ